MNVPYTRAPHQWGPGSTGSGSLHAALLIDFDNVTMGMRSDLSKELKHLLDSDVIKGKVSVQRAYADWRRYPQYIVPLSEASVDLIFAPAYGSNKKNATDIRMAIDALELVFIRPEIGTYILLTGDSDFSSLVLKLKEYGKYVIGVGIQESSSDILVQNCDEYYSYTSLTGLTKTTELPSGGRDPWVLVRDAIAKMVSRDDVMRSDRLKQVMQELEPTFDEGSLGFSKFSKFLAEASSRGLVQLKKLENGQYEVGPSKGGRTRRSAPSAGDGRGGRRERGRGARRERLERGHARAEATRPEASTAEQAAGDVLPEGAPSRAAPSEAAPSEAAAWEPAAWEPAPSDDPLQGAYRLLRSALEALREAGREPVRDSDVKRKILEGHPKFDEAELGFSKFSKFLSQAADHGVVRLGRTDAGNYDVSLPDGNGASAAERPGGARGGAQAEGAGDGDAAAAEAEAPAGRAERAPEPYRALRDEPAAPTPGPTVVEVLPGDFGQGGLRLGPRRGSTRRRGAEEPPSLFEGQTVTAPGTAERSAEVAAQSGPAGAQASAGTEAWAGRVGTAEREGSTGPRDDAEGDGEKIDLAELALPTEPDAIVRYLTHRYKGVGQKTAETLVERFGPGIFETLRDEPRAVASVIPQGRAEQLLEAWRADYERRVASHKRGRS